MTIGSAVPLMCLVIFAAACTGQPSGDVDLTTRAAGPITSTTGPSSATTATPPTTTAAPATTTTSSPVAPTTGLADPGEPRAAQLELTVNEATVSLFVDDAGEDGSECMTVVMERPGYQRQETTACGFGMDKMLATTPACSSPEDSAVDPAPCGIPSPPIAFGRVVGAPGIACEIGASSLEARATPIPQGEVFLLELFESGRVAVLDAEMIPSSNPHIDDPSHPWVFARSCQLRTILEGGVSLARVDVRLEVAPNVALNPDDYRVSVTGVLGDWIAEEVWRFRGRFGSPAIGEFELDADNMVVYVGMARGVPMPVWTVPVPPPPGEVDDFVLVVRFNHGVVLDDSDFPRLDVDRVSVHWESKS